MKFCKKCSAALEDDAVFCTECGASLADDNFSANSQSGNMDGFQGNVQTPPSNSENSYSSSNNYSNENNYSAGNNYSGGNNYYGNGQSQPQYRQPQGSNPGMPWLIVSIVAIFCCGGLFAIPGLVLSIMSTSSFNAGNLEDAKSKAKTAMWLTIGAIILGVIANIIGAVLFFSFSEYSYY